MHIVSIEGATRAVGARQGYLGLPIRDEVMNCSVNGPDTPVMVTAWQPTPDELARLVAGGSIQLRVLGIIHPPVILEVPHLPV